VIELIPEARIGFDAENMFVGTGAGPTRSKI
jgi:hypothetical protein